MIAAAAGNGSSGRMHLAATTTGPEPPGQSMAVRPLGPGPYPQVGRKS